MKSDSNYVEAILWVLLSTALFTLIFAAAKFADGAVGTFQILLLRYVGSLGTVLLLASKSGGVVQHRSKVSQKHFVRAVVGCSAAATITWASANMPVADASAVGMLYGVITVVLGMIFLKEHVGMQQWSAVLVSLAGAFVVMLSQGAFQSDVATVPTIVALLSAILMASEGLFIRVLSQTETAISMMLHISFFGILLLFVPAVLEWQAVEIEVILSCLALGPLSVLAQYCTIRGYRIAPLSVVGPVDYSWLVFATILGVVVFGEIPHKGVVIGGMLIILGGILLSWTRVKELN